MIIQKKKKIVLNVYVSHFLQTPFLEITIFLVEKHFGGKLMFNFARKLNHLHG